MGCVRDAQNMAETPLVSFPSFSEILMENRQFCLHYLHLTPAFDRVIPSEFNQDLWRGKTELRCGICWMMIRCTLHCYDVIPACVGQTDRRTDGQMYKIAQSASRSAWWMLCWRAIITVWIWIRKLTSPQSVHVCSGLGSRTELIRL